MKQQTKADLERENKALRSDLAKVRYDFDKMWERAERAEKLVDTLAARAVTVNVGTSVEAPTFHSADVDPENLKRWAGELEADDADGNEVMKAIVNGTAARIAEIYGDGWSPPVYVPPPAEEKTEEPE